VKYIPREKSGISSLRVGYIIAMVVCWNLLIIGSCSMKDGTGIYAKQTVMSKSLSITALGLFALSSILIVTWKQFRKIVVDPRKAHLYDPKGFIGLAILTIGLAVAEYFRK
jgi:hypothetical protein